MSQSLKEVEWYVHGALRWDILIVSWICKNGVVLGTDQTSQGHEAPVRTLAFIPGERTWAGLNKGERSSDPVDFKVPDWKEGY